MFSMHSEMISAAILYLRLSLKMLTFEKTQGNLVFSLA